LHRGYLTSNKRNINEITSHASNRAGRNAYFYLEDARDENPRAKLPGDCQQVSIQLSLSKYNGPRSLMHVEPL